MANRLPQFNFPNYSTPSYYSPQGTPPNINAAVPNLPNLTSVASGDIASELGGNLSNGTTMALQRANAERGVASGMPWAGGNNTLIGNRYLNSVAGATENLAHQGIGDYLALLSGVSGTLAPTTGQQLQNEQFQKEFDYKRRQDALARSRIGTTSDWSNQNPSIRSSTYASPEQFGGWYPNSNGLGAGA